MAAARCAVTDCRCSRGGPSRPSHAWNPTRRTAPIDGHRIERSGHEWSRGNASDRETGKRLEADERRHASMWIRPIQTWPSASRPGRNWPGKQPGHWGHASPDAVARTATPIVTSRKTVATVAAASRWKRDTDPPGCGRWILPSAGRPAAVADDAPLRFQPVGVLAVARPALRVLPDDERG